jgi:ubiquinone/menaquinone biosynthesis C-methylase UbiE
MFIDHRHYWLYFLIIFSLFILLIVGLKKLYRTSIIHTYDSNTRIYDRISKIENDCYDDFYCEIYDRIFKPDERLQYDVLQLMNTEPSLQDSTILDVGCGNGHFIHELYKYGVQVVGLDASSACLKQAITKESKLNLICGDASQSTLFPNKCFTHISCLYFTLYEIRELELFLNNVFRWLKQDGIFILHLVDVNDFSMISPAANVREELVKEFSKTKIIKSKIRFTDYTYISEYMFDDNNTYLYEQFRSIHNKRDNKRRLFMKPKQDILQLISLLGFRIESSVTYESVNGDKHQYLYTFRK